ncbi:pentapeptide repeat-containing protein [Saccharothrix variisporea]|uniref:pentapeptide repeat-containing protein n=1 Tax=Saccharothrix variisporea TaxID=543527 RepID=UPI0011C34549|nr:pentapeptide repeat-containing protein [Saccharothrix variisporea]
MIATVAALIATATTGLVVVLWWAGTAGLSGAELVTARFDALRTGLSIGVGGGGVFALYLAWRRQHATEIGLVQKERDQADVARAYELQRETAEHTRLHAERVAATTERDAEARRITDLYAKSVEQLGSDKAPIRHGGLYALERLAQDHPDNPALRQTVVNVLCAYLRAPFDLPGDPPDADADRGARDEHRERVQEREVRLTAQRILTAHLDYGNDAEHPVTTFWEDIDLDLTAAVLIDWSLSGCTLRNATFNRTTFIGDAFFIGVMATGEAWFSEATFTKFAYFDEVGFLDGIQLDGATIRYPLPKMLFDPSWPIGWIPSSDHAAIEGRDGTWHHFLKI